MRFQCSHEPDMDSANAIALRFSADGALVARLTAQEARNLRDSLSQAVAEEDQRTHRERAKIAEELQKLPAEELAELKRLLEERKGR